MFETQDSSDGFSIRMSAELGHIDDADAHFQGFLERCAGAVDPFSLRLLLREALLNAVVHGSEKDAGREVRLDVEMEDGTLRLSVEDEGPGFRWAERGLEVNILGDGGRGLPLMRIYSDAVEFNQKGNRITLTKRIAERTAA